MPQFGHQKKLAKKQKNGFFILKKNNLLLKIIYEKNLHNRTINKKN